jgi:hypothetical protein
MRCGQPSAPGTWSAPGGLRRGAAPLDVGAGPAGAVPGGELRRFRPTLMPCFPRPLRPCSALTSAVNALAAAARDFHLTLTRPRLKSVGGPLTGIYYLEIVTERHRRGVLHVPGLHVPTA